MASRDGATKGTTTNVISMKSRKKPRRNMTIMTPSIAPKAPPGSAASAFSIISSPPRPRKTSEKSAAPMRIVNTIVVTRAV